MSERNLVEILLRFLDSSVGEFDPFEASQLANLACETAEEAKALIPRHRFPILLILSSLSRHQDDHLQNLLNEMANLLKFQ